MRTFFISALITAIFISPALVFAQSNNLSAGTIVGGITGGYLGSQIKTGNTALNTILGSIAGGLLGSFLNGGFGATGAPSSGGVAKNTFGGKITLVWPCTCSPGLLRVTISPPKGGTFVLSPSTKLHSNARPVPGSWVMGDYAPSPTGGCYHYAGVACYPDTTVQGIILRIGTS